MKLRVALALILIVCLTIPASSRPLLKQNDEGEQPQLTTEEEQAARALALKFATGLRETDGDIEPLVQQFFVSDFDELLRSKECHSDMPYNWAYIALDPALIPQLNNKELRRLYVTIIQLFYLHMTKIMPRYIAESEDDESGGQIEDAIPPEIVSLVKNDPTFSALYHEWKMREAAKQTRVDARAEAETNGLRLNEIAGAGDVEEHDSAEAIVTTIKQVQALLTLGDKLIEAMYRYSAVHPAPPELADRANSEIEIDEPHLTVIDKETCGRPKETRFICVHIEVFTDVQFYLELESVGGELKIIRLMPVAGD